MKVMEHSALPQQRMDLGERTYLFASRVRIFILGLPKNTCCFEDGKQRVRSSGSIGANYIEANEALSEKDTIFRLKISRKEAKESICWLKLLKMSVGQNLEAERLLLLKEATELLLILSRIIQKYQ